jgi:hypothetical protein
MWRQDQGDLTLDIPWHAVDWTAHCFDSDPFLSLRSLVRRTLHLCKRLRQSYLAGVWFRLRIPCSHAIIVLNL